MPLEFKSASFWSGARIVIFARLLLLPLVGLFAATVSALAEEGIDVIVERGDGAVEIYMSLPAVMAVERFGLVEGDLVNADGYANFELFSQGTWDLGQRFRQDIELRTSDGTVPLEAMSLMLHPERLALPYETPLDAMISIEVCGARGQGIGLEEARVYVGLIAYPKNPQAAFSLVFPGSGSRLSGTLRDFTDHRLTREVELSRDEPVFHLEAGDTALPMMQSSVGVLGAVFVTLLGLSCVGVVYLWRGKRQHRAF